MEESNFSGIFFLILIIFLEFEIIYIIKELINTV